MRKKTLIRGSKYIRKCLNFKDKGPLANVQSILSIMTKIGLTEKQNCKNELFRQRTATQILKSGFTTGCTDDAIVFIAMAKQKGLNPIYLETLEKEWLASPMSEERIKGHAFVKVKNFLVEPQRKKIYRDPKSILNKYAIFGEAKEPYDLGLFDIFSTTQKLMDFKEKYKKANK